MCSRPPRKYFPGKIKASRVFAVFFPARRRLCLLMDNVKKILFISLSNVGDIVLTTPVFRKLRELFPDAVIDVVSGPSGKSIFGPDPAVRKVTVRRKRQSMAQRIAEIIGWRREKYDIAVDLKNSLVPLLVGARRAVPLIPFARKSGHMRDMHLRVIKGLGVRNSSHAGFMIPVSEQDRVLVAGILGEEENTPAKRIVTISPGAKSHMKRWPARKYAEIIDLLGGEYGLRVFIVGGEEDAATAASIISCVRDKEIVADLTGKTTIGALYELMRRSDMLLTNDSGPLHVASAAGTPTVAIFGPSNEKNYGPLSEKSEILFPDMPCRPCGKALCAKGLKDGCIPMIGVELVFESARKVLG